MWVLALAVSLGLFVLTIVSGRRGGWPTAAFVQLVWLVTPYLVCLVLPPVAVQACIGLAALPLLAIPKSGPRCYRLAGVGAFLAGWAVAGGTGVLAEREYARLRTVHPLESVAERLPAGEVRVPPAFNPRQLATAEADYADRLRATELPWSRTSLLRRLHEDQVGLFADAAGFGVGRMGVLPWPTAERLGEHEPPEPTPDPSVEQRLRDDTFAFADPAGWGYRRGDRVAGFLPHALRRPTAPGKESAVERLELVGLLLAPDPRVYVSDELLRMDRVAELPTRHLDEFESPALAKLRAGDELVHDAPAGRLLGAVRAARQCLDCHGGHRGDLLGAFSYRFRPN